MLLLLNTFMHLEGNISPNWSVEDFKNLSYKKDPDPVLVSEYANTGHCLDSMNIYNCFEFNVNFDVSYIKNSFKFLKNLTLAVNLFPPGQYIPLHADRYEKYQKLNNLNNSDNIIRIVLMLEDCSSGQIIHIKEEVKTNWKAGYWVGWKSSSIHAFYNMSKKNRYAVQLTGIL